MSDSDLNFGLELCSNSDSDFDLNQWDPIDEKINFKSEGEHYLGENSKICLLPPGVDGAWCLLNASFISNYCDLRFIKLFCKTIVTSRP